MDHERESPLVADGQQAAAAGSLPGPANGTRLPNANDQQRLPLTTPPISHYGTMEHSEKISRADTPQALGTSRFDAQAGAPPLPAVRRKIPQMAASDQRESAPPSPPPPPSQANGTTTTNEQLSGASKAATANEVLAQSISLPATMRTGDEEAINLNAQASGEPARAYPKKVLFIIANEFCERFSYYGLRTVLVLYFKSVLGFSETSSTVSFHLFATLCYLTPILGAILGDSILGKYKTILYLSGVYFLGEFILVLSSIFWDLSTGSALMTWLGLLLIGIGTGGIKPCVAAFAGDQFLPGESSWRENFFSLFYGAINLGSLISMFLTPLLRSNFACVNRNDCYPYAFGLPCLLIFIATLVFLLAHNHYYKAPLPKDNVILAFCQCTWLALKRKLAGQKLLVKQASGHARNEQDPRASPTSSATSSENEAKPVAPTRRLHESELAADQSPSLNNKRNHWLYLAADQFDRNSIEEFRSVLGLFLLFLPTPVYWCLFDQQGSLWTFQAARMDGRVFNTSFLLEPDQMAVANPLLLLTAIPLYQYLIYPALNRCNLITTPIQRMTTGGLIAALSFVASALIEFHMQANEPRMAPLTGQANLLLVNGLSDCSLVNTTINFNDDLSKPPQWIEAAANQQQQFNQTKTVLRAIQAHVEPLSTRNINNLPASNSSTPTGGSYTLSFNLVSNNNQQGDFLRGNTTTLPSISRCPFEPRQLNELQVGPLANQAVKLLYLEQGNGKLTHKLFNESLVLPPANKARIRLLYEFFGSYSQAQKRTFYLLPISAFKSAADLNSSQSIEPSKRKLQFNMNTRDGQVLLSDYLDVEITRSSGDFVLKSSDNLLNTTQVMIPLKLEAGTRNLLLLHQLDASQVKLKLELLQDNKYRVSMLWQLIPYTMISMSEVMFSITGLEFSYSMAPPNLKSLILGAWSLTTALGNILTVAVEAWHPFANIGHDFLFYAALMAADMLLFAILGYQYEPYQPYASKSSSNKR